jgi:hypothetical protein
MIENGAQSINRIFRRHNTGHTKRSVWNCGFHSPADEDQRVLSYNAPIFTVVKRVFLNYLKTEAENSYETLATNYQSTRRNTRKDCMYFFVGLPHSD